MEGWSRGVLCDVREGEAGGAGRAVGDRNMGQSGGLWCRSVG